MDKGPTAIVNWDAELKGAKMLIESKLVPKDITTPQAALFIILAGRDMGLSPVQSLRSIRPIQGKIECSADLQLGLFHRDGGKSRWLKLDASGAELELTATWLVKPHVSRFGVEEAKRAELMSSANYRKYPQAMFRSRAITAGLKDIGFLMGSGVYAPGEIGGTVTIDEATGEVLPGPGATAEPAQINSTAGVVEALDDQEREAMENHALTISEAVRSQQMEAALNDWRSLDNDQKVAVWAMLERDVRKAVKAADAAARPEVNLSEPHTKITATPTLRDALNAIKAKNYELAQDIARSLAKDEAAAVLAEVLEASKA